MSATTVIRSPYSTPVLASTARIKIPAYALHDTLGGPSSIEVQEAVKDRFAVAQDMLVPHRKDFYFFAFVREGNSKHWIDDRSYTLQNNTFYFSVPTQVHLKEEMRPMSGLFVSFTPEFLQMDDSKDALALFPILKNKAHGHELRLQPHDVVYIEMVMRQMLEEFRADRAWKQPMLHALLKNLLIYTSRLYSAQLDTDTDVQDQPLFKRFLALVREHYATLHEVHAYAEKLHVTPGHLNDLVKRQSGKTCMMHIQSQLLLEAKRRLMHTDLPVRDIGDELGFEDASYFVRFFKRHEHTTPLAYRKRIREMYH
jgi:AraC family transcriptional regulator, transcriptional activator of pobA